MKLHWIAAALCCVVSLCAVSEPTFAQQSAPSTTLRVEDVLALHSAGLGDEVLIAKIKASNQRFDLSTEQLLALKAKGLSSPVVAALVSNGQTGAAAMSVDSPDPSVPHPSGVYLLSDGAVPAKMVRMNATVSNQAKTGGILGYALTSGIASMSIKATIQNPTAPIAVQNSRPVFYFFFDESNPNQAQQASTWLSGAAAVATSPNEFTLVKLMEKKGRREARVGSINIAGAKTGVMDSDRVAFDATLIRPGVFKVQPRAPLAPGEYGFLFGLSGQNTGGAMTARVFDFSVPSGAGEGMIRTKA
ncbi:MAG: hypothetical protein RQ833_05180 [Sphingomonadaceae bacterium]|nr:hypothetical protein [Sphingomonadaceae bacterium]